MGAGGTARLLGFTRLVTTEADIEAIARSFSGDHLTHGVKTQRSAGARFGSTRARGRLRSTSPRGRSPRRCSRLGTAQNWVAVADQCGGPRSVRLVPHCRRRVLRAAARAGAGADEHDLHGALGAHWRGADGPVDVPSRRSRRRRWGGRRSEGLDDVALGVLICGSVASRAADRREAVGNAGYELTLTLPKSFSL